jgi:hypothetical protein
MPEARIAEPSAARRTSSSFHFTARHIIYRIFQAGALAFEVTNFALGFWSKRTNVSRNFSLDGTLPPNTF